ncbi:transglycosylase family protein [Mobilicoccus caccae]|uniref:Resuscitation-promoting factor core lysozyme-like domain-containing protein n=1 Tax=Mobilicoccus caccae TaxID=1859295 RepID=A0ABQ6IWA4_9MICO|nr:transglycosylase family protein [Mobilicoccus caccae]GMA40968.1 hypothetical protein GCM10025883_30130 [Mobilicoccus caccae]
MHYFGKHRAAGTTARLRRSIVTAIIGGATVVGGTIAVAPSASAAPVQPQTRVAAAGNVWDRVAACESGGNWKINTGNGYYGGLQFSASSWRAAGGARYANLPHRASKSEQIATAKNLLRMQGPRAWPSCGPRAGLTRANGAAAGGGAAKAKVASRSTQRASQGPIPTRSQVRVLQRTVGARVDGIVGPETVRKTQRHLGQRVTGASYLNGSTLTGAWRLIRA